MKVKIIDFGYTKLPERKHHNDTGCDVYLEYDVRLKPKQTVCIPCKFGLELPDGLNAHFQARTSIAKKGIYVHQCAIDAGYRGEIHMIVTNLSDEEYYFEKGDRLAYLEIYPCVYIDFAKNFDNERGTGAFGSTGR